MANEITISVSLAFSKGGVGSSLSESALQFDVSGTDYFQGTQQVPITTSAALNKGTITACGYCLMKNTDSTNFVQVEGTDGDTATLKLKAGEVALFRFNSNTPHVVADTAICMIDYLLIED